MNYELAKQLKENGFIQMHHGLHLLPTNERIDYPQSNSVYLPTLSELIEACGEWGFEALRKSYDGQWKPFFIAQSHPRTDVKTGTGNTPEEAVARLYISLNKKSEQS